MQLTSYVTETLKRITYTVFYENKQYILKEYYNAKNKIIDTTLQDSNGVEVSDPALLEKIQDFVDT
jgi:hypothetical protein